MTVFLPDRTDGLAALEKSLTPEKLAAWSDKFEFLEVRVTLPKFKLTSNFPVGKDALGSGHARSVQRAKGRLLRHRH